ncbi:MAG: hypothetical protein WCO63_08715 [Bacteroidota bacterium]
MHKNIVLLCWVLLLSLISAPSFSQTSIGSPYSRYGIGDMFVMNNTQNLSMGGAGLAWHDPGVVNYLNPASYAAFDTLSFIFDGGLGSKFGTVMTSTINQRTSTAALSHLLVGFPFNRWWKCSIGLLPYSRMGYNIGFNSIQDSVGLIQNKYTASGGINQVYFGNGFRLAKGLSLGFNVAYLFGTLSKTSAVTFPDSVYIYDYRITRETRVTDFLFTLGLQYQYNINKSNRIGMGMTFSNAAAIKAYESLLSETYVLNSTSTPIIKDTVQNIPETRGYLKFPMSLGFGLMYEHTDKWMLLLDYKFQNWKNFTYFGIQDSLKNSTQTSLGFQITPDKKVTSSYFKKVTYRAGLRYSETYLQLRGNRLTEAGITLGVSLPFPKSRSRVNLGMEIGRKGTTNNGLLKENFVKLSISATAFEYWFIRRKFE